MILLALAVVALLLLAMYGPRLAGSWRQNDEDRLRGERIRREYMVPQCAVEEPKGRRPARKEEPEMTSRYTHEPPR